jgi:hypothetical protein
MNDAIVVTNAAVAPNDAAASYAAVATDDDVDAILGIC